MAMKKKSNILINILKFIYILFYSIFKSLTLDIIKNFKHAWKYNYDDDYRNRIKHKMKIEKQLGDLQERTKILERIVYSISEDPNYLKTDKGKADLRDLKRSVK